MILELQLAFFFLGTHCWKFLQILWLQNGVLGLFFLFILCSLSFRKWLSLIITLWGIVTSASMFVNSKTSLYITRVLLGITEAGLFPGIREFSQSHIEGLFIILRSGLRVQNKDKMFLFL